MDGGGAKGVFTAGVLAALENLTTCPKGIGSHFDMIAGTSVGGIIALALGAGLTGREIKEQINNGVKNVFATKQRRGFRCAMPKYSRRALTTLIEEILGDHTLNDSNRMLCIPSVEGEYGEPCIFKTCHHPDFRKDWKEKMVNVALATSAAPTYYPAWADEKYSYVDGGICANDPIMAALVDALTCFKIKRKEIKILSIGCATRKETVTASMRRGGMLTWGTKVPNLFLQIASQQAQGQAGLLLGRNQITRISPDQENKKIDLDDWKSAIEYLPRMAARYAESAGERVVNEFFQTMGTEYKHWYPNDDFPTTG